VSGEKGSEYGKERMHGNQPTSGNEIPPIFGRRARLREWMEIGGIEGVVAGKEESKGKGEKTTHKNRNNSICAASGGGYRGNQD